MGRPLRYACADDLLSNCTLKDDCFIWPPGALTTPVLSPSSPMAKEFGTVSIVRILFTICRFVPASPKLVRHCANPFCVNPYHHAEAKKWMDKRLKLKDPHGLLPAQESRRHLIAPPDDVLYALRPTNPAHLKVLMDAAALAGFDAKGIIEKRSFAVPERVRVYAQPDKPVLVLKRKVTETVLAEAGEALDKPKKTKPVDVPVDEEDFETIFGLIERRDQLIRNGFTDGQNPEHKG